MELLSLLTAQQQQTKSQLLSLQARPLPLPLPLPLTPTLTQTLKPWLSLQTHVRALLRKAERVGVVPDAPSTEKVAAHRLTLILIPTPSVGVVPDAPSTEKVA